MNVKAIGGSAVIGFVLSFLTGIISGNSFFTVSLRAVLFALVFAVLAAVISFVYSKFLSDETEGGAVESPSERSVPRTGGNVDIVIQDDALDEDESGPKFHVENNRQAFADVQPQKHTQMDEVPEQVQQTAAEISRAEPVVHNEESQNTAEKTETVDSAPAFVPGGFENAEKVSPDTAVNSGVSHEVPVNSGDSSNKVNSHSDGSNIESVDQLPDIADFTIGKKSEGIGDIISDSDFASGKSSSGSSSFPDGSNASIQNADVMAQAIRTLLSKDN